MLSNNNVILIKLFVSFLFIFFFQDTIYAKEYAVNGCVITLSDDWKEQEIDNKQLSHSLLIFENEERSKMVRIIALKNSDGLADISETDGTESGRNAFVKKRVDFLMNHAGSNKTNKIIFSEFRETSSFGAAYIEYIMKSTISEKVIYIREYDTIKNSTLYKFSFAYGLEDDFTRGAEYDKQIVNNIRFYDKPADSLKNKLQQNLDNLVDDAKQQQKREDDARLYAFLHGGFKAAIYTAIFIGIAFLCKKFYK